MRDFLSNPFNNKPWMYSKPKGPKLSAQWFNEWSLFLLDYCEVNNIHLISKIDLKNRAPFNLLSEVSFSYLVLNMVQNKSIETRTNEALRIMWKSNLSWSDNLYDKAKEMNLNIIYGLDTLSDVDPKMLTLPKQDLRDIYQLLVNIEKARWVEKEKMILKLT